MNRFILSLLLLMIFALPMSAERKAELFARILPDREQVYAGDSATCSARAPGRCAPSRRRSARAASTFR